ncbi:MAG: hypothetical protein IJP34_04885 [Clostridia bacterium]|nr:hypothetical protein [Clostridia bacterium]
MELKKVLATDLNFPNLTIYRRMNGETQIGYEMVPNEDYVFYDSTANDFRFEPYTMEEIPVTYFYTIAFLPTKFKFDNFPFIAVERGSIDEKYIFDSRENGNC